MDTHDVPNSRPLARAIDRRRLMALLGGSAAVTGAAALVQSAATPAEASTERGTFDSVTRAFYAKYAGQKWAAIRKKLDAGVVFTVPNGFPSPGTYTGPDAVIAYLQQIFAAGYIATLNDVAGLDDYSLGVHDCQAPGGSHATAALVVRYTDSGLVAEGTFFGIVAA
jgi:hypothetical protein